MKKGKSGFTLLELLVVVGILAALVALALPFYQDYVNQSKLTAAQADLQTFKKALAMYDQLETRMYGSTAIEKTSFLPLVGKYLQDYRVSANATNPVDPWGNDYKFDVEAGAVWSCGPDGLSDVVAGTRSAADDDLLVTWKPDFFVASVRRVNTRTLELVFSRKVQTLVFGNVTTSGGPLSIGLAKVSDTIFRVSFNADLAASPQTVTVAPGVESQDGRSFTEAINAGSKQADGVTAVNVASY